MPIHDRYSLDLLSIGRISFGAAGFLCLVGCTDIANSQDQSSTDAKEGSAVTDIKKLDRSVLLERSLDNAIQVGDDLYMLPKGIDDDGCEMFGPHSTKNATLTALHYRQADGSFNIARDPAICGVEMVAIGPDDDGCERYQAQPVNPALSPTEVVYYQAADGRYVVYKSQSACSG